MCSDSILIIYAELLSGEKKWGFVIGVPKIQTPCSCVGKTMEVDPEKKPETSGNRNGGREQAHGKEGEAGW